MGLVVQKIIESENCCCAARDKNIGSDQDESMDVVNQDDFEFSDSSKRQQSSQKIVSCSPTNSQKQKKNRTMDFDPQSSLTLSNSRSIKSIHRKEGQKRLSMISLDLKNSPTKQQRNTANMDVMKSEYYGSFNGSQRGSVSGAISQYSAPSGNVMVEFERESQLLINKTERKILWTRNEIVQLFAKVESMKKFKNVVDEGNVKLSYCDVGTPMYKYAPLFKTEFIFDAQIQMNKVLQAMHNSKIRVKWDKNCKSIQSVQKVDRVELLRIEQEPHKLFNQKRDMFEKKFGFSHRPRVESAGITIKSDLVENYFYFSSMDSALSKNLCPVQDGFERTHICFGMHKFETIRTPKDDNPKEFVKQVKATLLLQMDLKLNKLKMGIYKTALPSVTKSFYDDLVKYLIQN